MNGELDFSSMKYVGFINYSNFIIPNSISDDVKFMIKIRLKLISSSDSQSVVLSPYASQSDLKSTEFNVGDTKELLFKVNISDGTAHIQVDKNCRFEVVDFSTFLANRNLTNEQLI